MRYWSDNRKSCEHVEPREDWKESIEKWIDWMDAIGRTNDTLRTRWYQIVRFSKAVDKSITDVTEDDLIFYHPTRTRGWPSCWARSAAYAVSR